MCAKKHHFVVKHSKDKVGWLSAEATKMSCWPLSNVTIVNCARTHATSDRIFWTYESRGMTTIENYHPASEASYGIGSREGENSPVGPLTPPWGYNLLGYNVSRSTQESALHVLGQNFFRVVMTQDS